MKTGCSFILLVCLGSLGTKASPQSAGVSAKLNLWRQDSFNSASSDYLYTSFREKVFEPLMDKLLGDVQRLKHGQMITEDLGYGSLATGIIALVGMLYLEIRMKMASKASRGAQVKNRNETTRVL